MRPSEAAAISTEKNCKGVWLLKFDLQGQIQIETTYEKVLYVPA